MKRYTPHPREVATEQVEAYIIKSGLGAGDRLPSERSMCEMWGLNRSTLRSALMRLNAAGRFIMVRGSGTRLSPRIDRTLQDLKGFSEYARDLGMKPESQLLSFSVVPCDGQLRRRFSSAEDDGLYRVARLRLLDGIPIMLETAYIPVRLAPGLEKHDLARGSLFTTLENCYGLMPDHGYEKISITFATVEEAESLGIEEGAPSFWIVSETRAEDETLIEYCRTVGRADRITLSSTLLFRESDDAEDETAPENGTENE